MTASPLPALWPGAPSPLGVTLPRVAGGELAVNIALTAGDADRVELCVFDTDGREHRRDLPERTGAVWHGAAPDLAAGTAYGFRVHGDRRDAGDVWNPSKLLLDPYARAIRGRIHAGPALLDDGADSAAHTARSIVTDLEDFDWEDDRAPRVPWHETVIYEAHVKGLTRRHPGVPPEHRGRYLGVGSPAIIDHIRALGVTAVELLPIHRFVSEAHLVDAGRTNYWGYNSIGYFAPHDAYATDDDGVTAVDEFRMMVRSLHRAGIEVILDVVYNHTAEGGPGGPILSFRGIDNAVYYRLDPEDRSRHIDTTGCGNSLDMAHPSVLQLVLDSLRHWVTEMHVDGFRFDLATALGRERNEFDPGAAFFDLIAQDPVLSRVKLIAEPWDVGEGGYQLGNFPPLWSEWNGRYRDEVRDFWRGSSGLGELADRWCGSGDLYDREGRRPRSSINFVTAHDGFTLADLTAYDRKHNEANGEDNRDGTDDNRSWNCGAEGPTDDPEIRALRDRQRRNLLATMFLSQGVPMLLSGDEIGHSQDGMNNAYAQDNEISWLDWDDLDAPLLEVARRLAMFRQAHPVLRRRRFLEGRPTGPGPRDDVSWFTPWAEPMSTEHWSELRCVSIVLNGQAITEPGSRGERIVDDTILVIICGDPEAQTVTLPTGAWPSTWAVAIDTADDASGVMSVRRAGDQLRVEGRSVVVLVAAAD